MTEEEDEEPWIGFDLDGTLAYSESGAAQGVPIGEPIAPIVALLKGYLARGWAVKILTARAHPVPRQTLMEYRSIREEIEQWCLRHVGLILPITHEKGHRMKRLYDDRAVAVERNTGRIVSPRPPEETEHRASHKWG